MLQMDGWGELNTNSKFLNQNKICKKAFSSIKKNHKRTTSSLAPPIFYVAKNYALKR